MCGLFFCENIENQHVDLDYARNNLMKRGRDEYNELLYNGDYFIHSRLSINSLNELGRQPYDGKNFILLFNGEIYNYHELYEQHKAYFPSEQSYSECNVIEVLIEKHGVVKAASMLRGMYALIIYAKKDGSVKMLRDPFGIKPLFYKLGKHGLQISSQASTLSDTQTCLSSESLKHYMVYGSVCSREPIFQGVNSIEPGIIYSYHNKIIESQRISAQRRAFVGKNRLEELEKILEKEIKLNSISEVKCGLLLSGGVDSALLAGLWKKYVKKPITAYNLSFANSKLDESERAKLIANELKIDYEVVRVNESNIGDYFKEFISAMDQPSVDGFNTFLVTKLIDNDVKVLISGAGADELFMGYDFYKHIVNRPKLNSVNIFLARLIHKYRPNRYTERYIYGNKGIIASLKYKRSSYRENNYSDENFDSNNILENIQTIRKYEIENYLRDTILFDTDQAGLANDKEIRPVYLASDIHSFAEMLNPHELINTSETKLILKELMSSLLPSIPFYKIQKKGFELPYSQFLNSSLHEHIGNELEVFERSRFRSQIDYKLIFSKWKHRKFTNSDWKSIILICWLNKRR